MGARLSKFYCMSTRNWSSFRKHPADTDFFLHAYNNIFSYLCNYLLTNPSSTDPPTHTTKKASKTFLFPIVEQFQLARNTDFTKKKKTPRFLDNGKMRPITDHIHRHNSPPPVQTLYQEKLYLQESFLVLCPYPPLHL